MTRPRDHLIITADTDAAGHAILHVAGRLDAKTYRQLRDAMIKAALAGPRAVIVDVSRLTTPAPSALAAFTSARWHVGQWPDVTIAIACPDPVARHAFVRQGVDRYVPVFDSLGEAAASIGACRYRRRARLSLDRDDLAPSRAHAFITDQLATWSMSDMLLAVSTVGRALVENALSHTDGGLAIRLETDDDVVTVAVSDGSTVPAARRETAGHPRDDGMLRGLDVVHALSRTWRNSPTGRGKTVWAAVGPEHGIDDVAKLISDQRR